MVVVIMETCTLRLIDHLVLIVLFTFVKSLDGTFTPITATDSRDATDVSRGFSDVAFTEISATALQEELATSRTEHTNAASTNFWDSLVGTTDTPRDFSESHAEMKSATELKSHSSTEGFTADHTSATYHSTDTMSSSSSSSSSEWMADSSSSSISITEREHMDFTHLLPSLSLDSRLSIESRTIRESPPEVSRLSTSSDPDPDSPSQTDSSSSASYISTTISRAGERTLLSVTSNSTYPYTTTTEDSVSSEATSSKAFVWEERTKGVTHSSGKGGDGSTSAGFDLTVTSLDSQRTPNSSEGRFTEGRDGPSATWTQSQTGLPNVTQQQGFEQTSDTEIIFSSTPPLIVLNNDNTDRGRGADVTDVGQTQTSGGTSHTESQGGVRLSTSPSLSLDDGRHSVTSQQDGGERTVTGVVEGGLSTEPSTGAMSTGRQGETDGVQPLTDEGTTVLGLTTASPAAHGGTVTRDASVFKSGRQPYTPETEGPTELDETLHPTAPPEAATQGPQQHTERREEEEERGTPTDTPAFSTPLPPTTTASPSSSSSSSSSTTLPTTISTRLLVPSTSVESHTQPTTIVTTDTTQGPAPSTPSTPARQEPPPSRTGGPHTHTHTHTSTLPEEKTQEGGRGGGEDVSTDVTTLHLETSTATPGNTTAQRRPTTASYAKTPAPPTAAPPPRTTQSRATPTATATTQPQTTTSATTHADLKPTTPLPGPRCGTHFCANGGTCVRRAGNTHSCVCLPAWTGPSCTKDVNECEASPCPAGSTCVNTNGSFSCECPLGSDLENGRECSKVKTFLGSFSVNSSGAHSSSLHEVEGEIKHLLNASLSILRGYIRSSCHWNSNSSSEWSLQAVNMFSISAEVNGTLVFNSIQLALRNCSQHPAHCRMHQYKLTYHAESLCRKQNHQCDPTRAVCRDDNGAPHCECREGFYKHSEQDKTCLACGDGYQLKNGVCVNCTFGFGGFNCTNFYKLIAIVVAPAVGGLLLILTIALIVTCCKKDKNDINKIIFKSGDMQMSPYADFPKSNRVSMEWGRETIEMQENGSTKNLLQMTDIYYSPALRNSDLERNGLYPFSGLPGSRHSCIYPAQWNPSFICDDSRRRDYF
ncbi:protein HEG [Engraulis encrasicolus]|uniref:protein HEG n=1 Tax=Engraulis encrasicolus TaxID=184585 RepID=UPI002FD620F7